MAAHIDIKLFGILFAIGKINFKQIGPVQFGIGQSLNTLKGDTDIIRIGMTSLVPNTKDEATGLSKGGSFGEKYIVRYALMQFHGFVNNNKANEVSLTESDVNTMLTATWNGTDALTTTSKFGQQSRLILKVNYKDNGYIGDLDLMTKLEQNNKDHTLENITQIQLNLDKLLEVLESNTNIIESIEYEYNPMLLCTQNGGQGDFEKIITEWSKDSKIPIDRIDFSANDNEQREERYEDEGEERIEADIV